MKFVYIVEVELKSKREIVGVYEKLSEARVTANTLEAHYNDVFISRYEVRKAVASTQVKE